MELVALADRTKRGRDLPVLFSYTGEWTLIFDNYINFVLNSTFFKELSLCQNYFPIYNQIVTGSDTVKKIRYNVVLHSQLGPRAGELQIQEEAGTVSGELFLLSRRNRFSGSVLSNGKYLISGDLRSRVDKEPYDAIFSVRQGSLTGGLVTNLGCWDLTGVEVKGSPREAEQSSAVGSQNSPG